MRLGTRLFLLVALASVLPAALVLLAGWLQLRHQVRLWTIPSVESALDASLQTNRRAFERLERHLEVEGRVLAESDVFPDAPADTTGLAEVLGAGCSQFGIDVAQFYAREDGASSGSANASPRTAEAGPDSAAAAETRFRLLASKSASGTPGPDASDLIRLPRQAAAGPERPRPFHLTGAEGDFLAVPTFLYERVGETPRVRGVLVLGVVLGPQYYDRITKVSNGLLYYRRLQEMGRVLRAGYGLLALAVLAVSLGLSLWIARKVSGSVSRPVDGLILGMEQVGSGARDGQDPLERAERSAIPEMIRLARAFRRMRETLDSAQARLQRLERVRGTQETARFVAHEIRNTMTPVQASLSVLARQIEGLEGPSRERGERALGLIRREADRLTSLAAAFSEYARFPEPRPVRLDLAGITAEIARTEVPSRIALEVEDPLGMPEVLADRDQMERAVRNLVRNAVEAIPDGGTIRIRFAGGERLRVEIEDTGCGIGPEALRKLFQPGYTTKQTGSGLGLALVRRSLSQAGGEIRIESEPGQGTKCVLVLPAAQEDDPKVAEAGGEPLPAQEEPADAPTHPHRG